MEAAEDATGEEVQASALDVEIKEEEGSEDAPQETECQRQQITIESTSIELEDEFGKWSNMKNFLGISGIKSDARLAGFLMNFWSDHKKCKQLEKKEKKKKKSKQRQEPAPPIVKIPVRMTSRGRPVYKPNILQVKLTSDSRSKKSKRRAALQKQRDAIKKAKIKKQQAAKKKRGQAKTKRKVSKVPRKEPREMKIIWRSDDEEEDDDDDDISEFFDDDADGDYTPAGRRKPRGLAKLAADTEFSDGELSDQETQQIKPKAGQRGRKRVMKRGDKLPPKKRKYLDKTRLKGETWYRCRIKKMMKYTKRFQCKICLVEVSFITEVIDHIQNEHADQISGFRTSLGPHLERCGLTVVWSLPELPESSQTTPGADRDDGSVLKNMTDAPGGDGEGTSALKLGNDKNGGEDEREGGGDGFPMGGGILKGGYMSLLVGNEANASSREADAQEGDGEPDTNSKKADEEGKQDGIGEGGDRRAVAVLDGQTDVLFKDRQSDSQVTNLEEDVDVLYELQGWVVIMIECPDCQEYVSIYSLPKHQFLHNKPKQEHKCDKCNKVYRRLNLLRNHQKRHMEKPPKPQEEDKTFMCELCGDVFRKAKYLKNHQLRHQGNLPFVCKICDRRFLFQRQLKRHDIIHRDVKPILCQECGRGFVQRSQLNAHMRQHTGEKPYKCDLCERAFTHNVSLKTHKKRDHGVQVGKCANPHLGRPKMGGEGVPKSKGTRATSSRKASQTRNQTVINNPPTSQYSECRMVNPIMNHLPLGLVINPDRQGMDLSMDSSDSPPGMDSNRAAPMQQSRTDDRAHRERQASIDRQSATIHNMDTHSRPNHSEGHSNMEHLGNPHIERSVINMDRHAGNGAAGNSSANSGGSHNSHSHFERAMAMPLIERSLGSHLMDRQGLSPTIDSRAGNAHSHHMDHHHHQGGIPLIARPDMNQHLMRQKKGKELEMPPHQNNPSHPPYPWGAWGNAGEGMGMRFPVFPQ